MAVGMAMNGMRPVIEMQFDAFAYPAFEQIVSHVAKMHNRTKGAVKLPIVIRVPYAGGIGGVEHHCDSSESYYAHTAGLKVFTPATVADGYRMLREAIDSDDPVMFMEPKKLYWSKDLVDLEGLRAEHAANAERGTSSEGRAAVARPGTDATLIAYGPSVPDRAGRRCRGGRGGPLAGSHRRPLHRAVRRRDRLRVGPQDRPCRGDRRGPWLRVGVLGDRGTGPGALLPLPGRADPPRHRLRRARTRRRSLSTITCPAWTASSTPLTTSSGKTDQMSETKVFLLPDLGEGLTEAELVNWLVAVGDEIRVDQPIAEVETAKSMVEVPSPYAGTVAVLHGEPGQTLDVGKPLISVTPIGVLARTRWLSLSNEPPVVEPVETALPLRSRSLPRRGKGRLRQRPHRIRNTRRTRRRPPHPAAESVAAGDIGDR